MDPVFESIWKMIPSNVTEQLACSMTLCLIYGMDKIQEIRVDTRSCKIVKNQPSFAVRAFGAALRASSRTLTSLNIKVSLPQFRQVITPCLKFPSLKNLTIQMEYGDRSKQKYLSYRLLSFIIDHRRTLVSFGLVSLDDGDMSSLLQRLPVMPLLRTLNLVQGRETWHYPSRSIGRIYSMYSPVLASHRLLRHLSLEMTPTRNIDLESFFQMEWCRAPLPKLESLTLMLPLNPSSNPGVLASYLQQYTSSLTSLTLLECPLPPQHLETVLAVFRVPNHLRNLELEVHLLIPDTFTAIAASLPNLECLKLTFRALSLEDYDLEASTLWTPPPTVNPDDSDWALVSYSSL